MTSDATTPPGDGNRLADQLCFAAYALSHAFGRAYREVLEPLGLTYPQYLVLLVLWERGSAPVGEIGRELHLDSGTLTPLLKRMEAAGLVTRRRSRADERVVTIALTDRGHDLREPVTRARETIRCAVDLPPDVVADLRARLEDLRRALDRPEGAA